ncbi:hypothetical protein FOL47_008213 [Perkinsus chesapeaki]|uniref:Tc1-like transposase DDE domain-containing protein n=1 Tax=Perkinsus chesapeaki TaxID=330153 RepID=A0A7J6LFH6_PERCH|nr:hypothetical protein FOL47_008213 [Perkinsus chesapeaki]
MAQLTDMQRYFIACLREDKPLWGARTMRKEFPRFFENISDKQVRTVLQNVKQGIKRRKPGSGRPAIAEEVEETVATLLQSDKHTGRRHLSQREASKELHVHQSTVSRIAKKRKLRCFRRVRAQVLKEAHRTGRKSKAHALWNRFRDKKWRAVWFSDEARFSLNPTFVSQNERVYREVEVKTDIPEEELIVENDSQGPTVLVYGSVSWYGKTPLFFATKNINQETYREMLEKNVFPRIRAVMGNRARVRQQNGATPHTATNTQTWLEENTNCFIRKDEWPSKSPDLNVMDYGIWGILQSEISKSRCKLKTLDDLRDALTKAWDAIPLSVIKSACQGWRRRLRLVHEVDGGHFEHLT